jgi:hypothetical protein
MMKKKPTKPLLIYIGFFFVLIGIISIFFVKGLNEVVLLPLCLLIGAICLVIGFTIMDLKDINN